jgi:hypothetical protein
MWLKKPGAASKVAAAPRTEFNTFRSVTVVSAGDGCSAAKALSDQKLLVADAPALPLSDCAAPLQCRCRFEKHVDRRDDEDGRRLSDVTQRASWEHGEWYSGQNRRKVRSRRSKD